MIHWLKEQGPALVVITLLLILMVSQFTTALSNTADLEPAEKWTGSVEMFQSVYGVQPGIPSERP